MNESLSQGTTAGPSLGFHLNVAVIHLGAILRWNAWARTAHEQWAGGHANACNQREARGMRREPSRRVHENLAAPLGTDEHKDCLETAPFLIAVFA